LMHQSALARTVRKFHNTQIMLPVALSHLKRGLFSPWPEKAGIAKNGSRLSMVSWSSSLQLVA
jgi:hypothetical protein